MRAPSIFADFSDSCTARAANSCGWSRHQSQDRALSGRNGRDGDERSTLGSDALATAPKAVHPRQQGDINSSGSARTAAAIAAQALALQARPSRRQPRHAIQPDNQATSTPTTTDARWGHFKPSRRRATYQPQVSTATEKSRVSPKPSGTIHYARHRSNAPTELSLRKLGHLARGRGVARPAVDARLIRVGQPRRSVWSAWSSGLSPAAGAGRAALPAAGRQVARDRTRHRRQGGRVRFAAEVCATTGRLEAGPVSSVDLRAAAGRPVAPVVATAGDGRRAWLCGSEDGL